MITVEVGFQLKNDDATTPAYATLGASGADLHASCDAVIQPGKQALISTGIVLSIPPNVEAQVRPRSGLAAKHGITVLNTPGTIDSDYRGEVKVILFNQGSEPFHVEKGMRIAQLVFAPVYKATFIPVDSIDETKRGAGGFGSTGK